MIRLQVRLLTEKGSSGYDGDQSVPPPPLAVTVCIPPPFLSLCAPLAASILLLTISVALLGKIAIEQRRDVRIPATMKIKIPMPKFQGPEPGMAGE